LTLIKFAENDVRRRFKNGEKIDYVWIFFDKDDFKKDDFDNGCKMVSQKNIAKILNEYGDTCDKNQIHWEACWSNESFEVWPLLHFIFFDTSMQRQTFVKK